MNLDIYRFQVILETVLQLMNGTRGRFVHSLLSLDLVDSLII